MGQIILMKDLVDIQDRRESETIFYTNRLDDLNKKLFFIQKEIDLTQTILRLIEKDRILDLRRLLE